MRLLLVFIISLLSLHANSQSKVNLEALEPNKSFDNTFVQKLFEDSHQSSFVIWVKHAVPEHYHAEHTEVISVISGSAIMTMNDSTFAITKGDYLAIPEGTKHSVQRVTSETPLKVLSVQTPLWDPKDRLTPKHK